MPARRWNDDWTAEELHDVVKEFPMLQPDGRWEYAEGSWWLTGGPGPKRDFVIGPIDVADRIVNRINAELKLSGADAFSNLSSAIAAYRASKTLI